MFIIPDEVLNTLTCSSCTKYLSVLPVKIYQGGIVKCGRCSKDEDAGIVSMYENIIKHGLFPCINRYEGCKQLLTYSEVQDHEQICVSGKYSCPECPSNSTQYTAYHLVFHFKIVHPNQILDKPVIRTSTENMSEKNYMYKESDFIYILNIRCDIMDQCFLVNASCLGSQEEVSHIVQSAKCYLESKNGEEVFYKSIKRKCTPYDINSECFQIRFSETHYFVKVKFCLDKSGVNCFYSFSDHAILESKKIDKKMSHNTFGLHNHYPKMYLSETFKQNYPFYYLSPCYTKLIMDSPIPKSVKEFPRICYFCENIFPCSSETLLFTCNCTPIHIYCSTCYNIVPRCEGPAELKNSEHSHIYKFIYFYCRWNCNRFYCGSDLRYHEDHCKENPDAHETTDSFALKYFKTFSGSNESHIMSRSNIFSFKEYNFTNSPKIFVITRDYFKFILHCNVENKSYHFWISHNYPCDKYYILFKIKDKFIGNYSRVNTFSINNSRSSVLGFTVLLRKISK